MKKIVLWGGASQKIISTFEIDQSDLGLDLMTYLHSKKINIASSCKGEGICQKCLIWKDEIPLLACQNKISDILNNSDSITVKVSYL